MVAGSVLVSRCSGKQHRKTGADRGEKRTDAKETETPQSFGCPNEIRGSAVPTFVSISEGKPRSRIAEGHDHLIEARFKDRYRKRIVTPKEGGRKHPPQPKRKLGDETRRNVRAPPASPPPPGERRRASVAGNKRQLQPALGGHGLHHGRVR